MVAAAILTVVAGCGKSEQDKASEAYHNQVVQCRDELAKRYPLIPIIGGGYLDTGRFAFNVPSVAYKYGQCGTDMFVTEFYWTGEKIVPAHEKFTGFPMGQLPSNWIFLRVGMRLGDQRRAKECETNLDREKCPKAETVGYPLTWLEELVVKPKNYPGLEIWLDPKPPKNVASIHFVLTDWRRKDGRPRTVNCNVLGMYSPWQMTKQEFEDIDFGKQMFSCQVEYWDFSFEGGAARVITDTSALKEITPALKALHQYISGSIIRGN